MRKLFSIWPGRPEKPWPARRNDSSWWPRICFWVILALFLMLSYGLASDSDDQCDYEPAPEFTWEGELNPNHFDDWPIIRITPASPFEVVQISQNPDETSTIKLVAMYMLFDGSLIAYRYFKDGQPYSYVFDGESKYVEYKFTDEERKGCMECHQDKLLIQEAI